MLFKAKNRKLFYFLILIILISVALISPVLSDTLSVSPTRYGYITGGASGSTNIFWAWEGQGVYDQTSGNGNALSTLKLGMDSGTITNYWNFLYRGWATYDTSAIPDDKDVLDAHLNISLASKTDDFSAYLCIVYFNVSNPTSCGGNADYNNFDSLTYQNISLSSLNTGYNNISVSGITPLISKSSYTKLGFRIHYDANNYPYPWLNNKISQITGNTAPVLYIEYGDLQNIDIDVSPTSGASPLAVSFTDKSEGFTEGVDAAYLDYGDGNSYSGLYGGYDSTRNYIYLDAGTYNYSYRLTHEGENFYSNGTVTVTGDSTVNFQVIVKGLNGAYIGNATVNIWYDSGTMTDSALTDDFYGSADFYVNPSRYVNGNVTKDGYYTSNFTYYVCPTGYCSNEQWITLYTLNETPGSGDEFGNYLVTFKNIVTGENVGYSNIEVYSDSGYTTLYYDEYSNAGGVWTGLVPRNIDLYYKYPETTGYYSQSWSYNLTSSPAYKTVNLVPKSGATSTTTPTPTTTTTAITPAVTYTYNDSNLSTLNVKEKFTNLLVLAGFQNAESADLIFAMIIILGCTALIGWITLSGSGAGMGAIIGFVFSLGLGLIPLWLLISAIFLGSLYVSLKLFGGTGE
jgi:hypothetical protein